MATDPREKSPEESDEFSGTVFLPGTEDSGSGDAPSASDDDNSRTFVSDSELLEESHPSQTVNLQDPVGKDSSDSSGEDNSRTFMMETDPVEMPDTFQTVDLSESVSSDSSDSVDSDNTGTCVIESDLADDPSNLRTVDSQTLGPILRGPSSEDSNLRTFVMDDESDDVGLRTVDSRTINMEALGDGERKIWENVAAEDQERSKTFLSHSESPAATGEPGMESNLLLLSRRMHERDESNTDPTLHPDYEILRVLGRGGMGVVYEARQASLDRSVAIKVIQTVSPSEKEQFHSTGRFGAAQKLKREQFLSEAVVTGDLDHPNIVPIYDVARTHEGDLFYSMKRVEGTPWDKVIKEKSTDDNLDILLKVADAVAFAHSRGVVHRDIKPENVMLGEFGAVMLMDWGLAVPTPEFRKLGTVRQVTSLGGSPAYMAPELAMGPIPNITPASDIYLLGAVLYQIVAGRPPHSGSAISLCLRAAAENIIEPVPAEKQGELYHIAMKAMEKNPKDRYPTVQDLQGAIRKYRSHTESINLAKRAAEDVDRALDSGEYGDYARAVFGYEEAIELWDGNDTARQGAIQARLAYAEAACLKEDFDLGLSLLDEKQPEFDSMITLLKQGQKERSLRRSRLVAFRRTAAALIAVIFIGGGGMSWKIFQTNQQLTEAVGTIEKANETIEVAKATVVALESDVSVKQQELRNEQEKVVLAQKEATAKIALANREATEKIQLAERDSGLKIKQAQMTADLKIAEAATQVEMVNKTLRQSQSQLQETVAKVELAQAAAVKAAADAARAEADANYVNYASAISQARSYLDQNQHGQAYQILKGIQDSRDSQSALPWEWQRLWFEANRARRETSTAGVPVDGRQIRYGTSGRWALATYDDGGLELVSIHQDGADRPVRMPLNVATATAALSPDERLIAAAGTDGAIRLLNRQSGQTLGVLKQSGLYGSTGPRIHALQFLTDELLIAGSQDATIRLWDVRSGKEVGACWNLAPVLDFDFVSLPQGSGWLVAAAVSDPRNGRCVVWKIIPEPGKEQFTRVAEFLGHNAPVLTVDFHPDGQTIASADQSGRILLWNWEQVGQLNYHDRISKAVSGLRTGQANRPIANEPQSRDLTDPELGNEVRRLSGSGPARLAHRDAIQKLRFSPDGRLLVSASNDFTLKVWNTGTGRLVQTLRGQGGPVRSVDFSPGQSRLLMSAGSGGLLAWNLANANDVISYREHAAPGENQFLAHQDEILSASFDRSGTRIVTSSRDHTARVLEIDPQRQEIRQIADLKEDPANAGPDRASGSLMEGGKFVSLFMQGTEDQSWLFVGGADGIIRIWNVPRAIELGAVSGTGLNTSFAISADGSVLLSGSSDPDARALVWTINEQGQPQRAPRWKLQGHQDTVTAFAVSRDGRRLLTGDRQGLAILWDAETGRQIGPTMRQHVGARMNRAVFSENGSELLIAGDNRLVSRVNVETGEVIELLRHDGFVTDLSLAPNGKQVLTITQIPGEPDTRTRLQLWTLGSAEEPSTSVTVDEEVSRRALSGEQSDMKREIRSVRFSLDPSVAFSVQYDSLARRSSLKIWRFTADEAPQLVRGLAFPTSIAATELATPGPLGQIFTLNGDAAFLWDLETLGHRKSYRPHAAVTQASFSADGSFIATSSRTVKIWNLHTQKTMAQLEFPHQGAVRSVTFSPVPGSYRFLTAGDDGIVNLWNWQPDTGAVQKLRTLTASESPVRRVLFSSDGELILAVGDSGMVKIWQTDSDQAPLVITEPEKTVDFVCCALSEDKRWLAVGSKDRIARLWQIAPDRSSAKLVRRFSGHADELTDIKFLSTDSPENFRVISASRDTLSRVWDPRIEHLDEEISPRELLVLRSHSLGVTAIDTTDRGRLVMSAGLDGEVILWPTRLNSAQPDIP